MASPLLQPLNTLKTLRYVKRFMVALLGGTVLLIGVAMILLPGPAIIVIPAGLAILATEFVWAQRWLNKTKAIVEKARNRRKKKPDDPVPVSTIEMK